MKALLLGSNASREESEKLQKRHASSDKGKMVLPKTVEGAGWIRVYLVKDMQVLQGVI